MTRMAINITQPIYRHFMPISKDLVFHTPVSQTTEWFKLNMKPFLIQGAYPLDARLISTADSVMNTQFQGGYRCFLEIVTQPVNGDVRFSDDQLGFAYKPKLLLYRGGDAFSYRLINVMGQESDVACISLFVRM
jgi:hypothetical protein